MWAGSSWPFDFEGVDWAFVGVLWLPEVVDSIDNDDTLLAADNIEAINGGVMPRSKELFLELKSRVIKLWICSENRQCWISPITRIVNITKELRASTAAWVGRDWITFSMSSRLFRISVDMIELHLIRWWRFNLTWYAMSFFFVQHQQWGEPSVKKWIVG